MSRRLARKGSIREYKVGDLVWSHRCNDFPNRLGKLDTCYAGPFPIVSRLGPFRYQIKAGTGRRELAGTVNPCYLRPL
jgi:hypothetical protein